MHYANISEIVILEDRIRSKASPEELSKLKESIINHGLLHAPVFWFDPTMKQWILVAGWRRTKAITALHKEGKTIFYDGRPIPQGQIPFSEVLDHDEPGRIAIELEENTIREQISWQDEAAAVLKIHNLRKSMNPKQTVSDTAREILESKKGAPEGSGPTSLSGTIKKVNKALIVAKAIENGDTDIIKHKNLERAYNQVEEKERFKWEAELVRRVEEANKSTLHAEAKKEIDIRHGDMRDILPQLDDGSFELILTDPPYGQNAGVAGMRQRTFHHHNYDDSPEYAKELAGFLLSEGFRIAAPRANIFMFCTYKLHTWLVENAARVGWVPFETPIPWIKSETEGLAPWGRNGWRRTHEAAFHATKGGRGTIYSPIDQLRFPRVPRYERVYGAQKPLDMMKFLIETLSLPGESVLDPCCGSGTTLRAAKELRRPGLGIELDKSVADMALVRVNDDLLHKKLAEASDDEEIDFEEAEEK